MKEWWIGNEELGGGFGWRGRVGGDGCLDNGVEDGQSIAIRVVKQ